MEYNEVLNELMKGTNFEVSMESQVLTSSQLKVRTPIEVINCLLGGGLPLNGIYHTWGPPKGGKSTWLYQTMGIFQQTYPEGISVILDMESSADPKRLESLGVNPSKVMRLPATSIESGFISLFKIIANKQSNKQLTNIPMFVIWDTISRGLAQDGATQSRMNAQDRARIIKNYMPDLASRIERQPFILGLINQVIYEVDRYGNRHANSGGGIALQHDNHMSLFINYRSTDYDETGSFVTGKWSVISIDKSKLSPEVVNIPFRIDVTKGGFIEEKLSFIQYCLETLKYIEDNRGWFTLTPIFKMYENTPIGNYIQSVNKSYRYGELISTIQNSDILYNIFRYTFMNYIKDHFSLQANIINDYYEQVKSELDQQLLDAGYIIVDDNTNTENSEEVTQTEIIQSEDTVKPAEESINESGESNEEVV